MQRPSYLQGLGVEIIRFSLVMFNKIHYPILLEKNHHNILLHLICPCLTLYSLVPHERTTAVP